MAIKRYYAKKDSTITDAYMADLTTRATGSNAGLSDIIEVFSIYGQVGEDSVERSRILIQFDESKIKADRTATGDVPSTAKYYLKLFNAEHSERLPRNFEVTVKPVTSEWDEGEGLDLINYTHKDESSWRARKSDKIAQVLRISGAAAVGANNYSNHYITIWDGSNKKYNFYFVTAAEDSSNQVSGEDVAVSLLNMGGDTVLDRLKTALDSTSSFTTGIADNILTITNSTKGDANNHEVSTGFTAATVAETVAGVDYTAWTTPGGDFDAAPAKWSTQTFDKGTEDLEIDITTIVNEWEDDSRTNYGLAIMMSLVYENGTREKSYYTKRFFARGTEFYFKQPLIEARWDSALKDDRNRLTTANPHIDVGDNAYSVYYQNWVNGALKDFPTVAGAEQFPKFSLTTDKDLAQKVTLATNASNVILSDSPNDVTQNSFATVKILNTTNMRFDNATLPNKSEAYFNLFAYNAANQVAHTYKFYWYRGPSSPASLLQTGYYKLDASSTDTVTSIVVRVGPWNEDLQRGSNWDDGTPARRAHSITSLTAAINSLAADHFHAVANGDTIAIYTRDAGAAGNNELMRWYKPAAAGAIVHVEVKAGTAEADAGTFVAQSGTEITDIKADLTSGALAEADYRVVSTTFGGTTGSAGVEITSTKPATGVYKASFLVGENVNSSVLYEKWTLAGKVLRGHGGSLEVPLKQWHSSTNHPVSSDTYFVAITNLKEVYSPDAKPRFKVFIRRKNTKPNIVSVNRGQITGLIIPNVYYSIHRVSDNFEIIPYGLGPNHETLASYNSEGSYFDLDISMLQPGFSYGIRLMFLIDGQMEEQVETFKFRVEKKISNAPD